MTENDLIDFTLELRAEALELLADVDLGPLFTPFSEKKGLLYGPGPLGGANWTGAAFDPDTHVLYVRSINWPMIFKIVPADPAISDADYVWEIDQRLGPQGLPFVKPPYGSVTAIDLDTGELLLEMELPSNVTGAPMTYMAYGRQYIVFASGGVLAPASLTALVPPGG